ncbi:unannotated protein [freshwater metagenome]|uniref:Unannotated protein n=1 Tax=freshwater metagenome TaxID=449393 RepID=A0A6J7C209_9ZZZZ
MTHATPGSVEIVVSSGVITDALAGSIALAPAVSGDHRMLAVALVAAEA